MFYDIKSCRRILVLGSPGSGKTKLSNNIAQKANCTVYHLDDLYWIGNWERRDPYQFKTRIEKILEGDNWIIEGNYYHLCFQQRLNQADAVVLLDIPPIICLYRVLKRYLQIALGHTDALPENIRLYAQQHRVKSNINLPFLWFVLRFKSQIFRKMKIEILKSNCKIVEVHWNDERYGSIL